VPELRGVRFIFMGFPPLRVPADWLHVPASERRSVLGQIDTWTGSFSVLISCPVPMKESQTHRIIYIIL
jgi:hypothetical protein